MIIYYTVDFKGGRVESHRLLQKAIAEYTGDAGQAKQLVSELKTGEMGKPYIEGFSHFSISHTGSIWAVLIADAGCGLDIQLPRGCDIRAISRRIFAPEDAAKVDNGPSDMAQREFFRIWARREALAKAAGGSAFASDLPSVDAERVIIDGTCYAIADTGLPGLAELYAAVAVSDPEGTFFENVTFSDGKIRMEAREIEKKKKTALETAYAYLESRMRTTEEVRRHLRDKGYDGDETAEVISELTGLKYLDDYLYALRYYEHNREKKRGSLRAERELIEKGVDKETARNAKEDFLYGQKVDEYEDALEIARKEVFVSPDVYGEETRAREVDDRLAAKIARKLEGKGFSRNDIFRVLDSIKRGSDDNN